MTPRKKNKQNCHISHRTISPFPDRKNAPTSDQSIRIRQQSSTTSSSSTDASSTGQPPTLPDSSSQQALLSETSNTTSQHIHPLLSTSQQLSLEYTSTFPSQQDTPSISITMGQDATTPTHIPYGYRDPFKKLNNHSLTVDMVISIIRRASQTGKQGTDFLC